VHREQRRAVAVAAGVIAVTSGFFLCAFRMVCSFYYVMIKILQ